MTNINDELERIIEEKSLVLLRHYPVRLPFRGSTNCNREVEISELFLERGRQMSGGMIGHDIEISLK
jgi:hypothetical protein